jgi:hypothetical protein
MITITPAVAPNIQFPLNALATEPALAVVVTVSRTVEAPVLAGLASAALLLALTCISSAILLRVGSASAMFVAKQLNVVTLVVVVDSIVLKTYTI